MHESEENTGLLYRASPRLKIYPTVAAFRNSTGEPGWVAASTRGRTIQMQPSDVLREAGTLESTIRHELLHMLIDSYALPGTPLWFREGLVLYLTAPNASSQRSETFDDLKSLEKSAAGPGERGRITARLRCRPCAGSTTCAAARQTDPPRLGSEWIAAGANCERGCPALRRPLN